MKQPVVSVIVPVYKAENYLRKCVDSFLVQTFQDFELILVDDGSPDKSGALCDEYAKKDKRVQVIHKQNGGVSSARQCGLEAAIGDYIIHADPDDWVDATMLEELTSKALETQADMVICDYFLENKDSQVYVSQKPTQLQHDSILVEFLAQKLHASCCNKLVRKSCLEKYKINFPMDIIRWEDLWVNCCLLINPIKVVYLPKAFYHYDQCVNSESIVRVVSKNGVESQILFCKRFYDILLNHHLKADDLMYECKAATKELMYASQLYTVREVRECFSEINNEYIIRNNHFSYKRLYAYCLSKVLLDNEKTASLIMNIFKHVIIPIGSYIKHLIIK